MNTTDFNDPEQRKAWEAEKDFISSLTSGEVPHPNIYKFLKDMGQNVELGDLENSCQKCYKYGKWQYVKLYKFSNCAVIHKDTTNSYFAYKDIQYAFTVAKLMSSFYSGMD